MKSNLYTGNSEHPVQWDWKARTDGAVSARLLSVEKRIRGLRGAFRVIVLDAKGREGPQWMRVDCLHLCTSSIARPTQGCPACWARGLNNPTIHGQRGCARVGYYTSRTFALDGGTALHT